MSYYRLYFLDPNSGHIERFEEYDSSDDGEAITRAEDRLDAVPLELWSGRRKVAHLRPERFPADQDPDWRPLVTQAESSGKLGV